MLATHLTEVIKRHADELLTRQQTHKLLDALKEKSPKAVDEDVIPEIIKVAELHAFCSSSSASACRSAISRRSSRRWATGAVHKR